MGCSLSERIAKNQGTKKGSNRSKNKVAFLALKQDIAAALSDGWSMKAIWETLSLEKSLSCSYKTFCVYVSQLLETQHTPQTQEQIKEEKLEERKANGTPRGFTFNPIPNLKELV